MIQGCWFVIKFVLGTQSSALTELLTDDRQFRALGEFRL